MINIYHNPRCSKSRQGLALIEASGKDFKVIKYLDDKISEDELKIIISKLGIKPLDLIRKNEVIWKQEFKNKSLTDAMLIKAMVDNPKLIERPIVINKDKAAIGRPPENILHII